MTAKQKRNISLKNGKHAKIKLSVKQEPLSNEENYSQIVLPEFSEVEKELLQCIKGQDKQVKQILTAIYRGKLLDTKNNLLISGSQGTGKTEIINQILKRLNIAYIIEDATSFYSEEKNSDNMLIILNRLLASCKYDINKAEQGIIVLDKVDRMRDLDDDNFNGNVLKSLISFGTMQIKLVGNSEKSGNGMVDFDSSKITLIYLGDFSDLEDSYSVGFAPKVEKKGKKDKKLTSEDLIEFGMDESFVESIDSIIELNSFNSEDLSLILKTSDISLFKRYQMLLEINGIELVFDENLYELIAEEVAKLDTGAKELGNFVNNIFEKIMHEFLMNPGSYSKCELSLEIVKDNSKYKLS